MLDAILYTQVSEVGCAAGGERVTSEWAWNTVKMGHNFLKTRYFVSSMWTLVTFFSFQKFQLDFNHYACPVSVGAPLDLLCNCGYSCRAVCSIWGNSNMLLLCYSFLRNITHRGGVSYKEVFILQVWLANKLLFEWFSNWTSVCPCGW